jgi:hypothetical protein
MAGVPEKFGAADVASAGLLDNTPIVACWFIYQIWYVALFE